MTMTPWNDQQYQKIKNVKLEAGKIVLSFENGDTISLLKETVVPAGYSEVKWDELSSTSYEVSIPAKPSVIEIPWDKLRVLTDIAFAKWMAGKAEEQSKLIGLKIKRLRERKNIKSVDLADRAGVTPQTISRIEQGRTDLNFATLRKLLAVMGYTLKDLANEEAELEFENQPKSFAALIKRLVQAGIDSRLLARKIIPARIQEILNNPNSGQPEILLNEAASYVSSIYGWSPQEIFGNQQLVIANDPSRTAFYKKPNNAVESQIRAYSHYAHFLAKITLKITPAKDTNFYPDSLENFKEKFYKAYETLTLENLLKFAWDLGIAVIPLNDSGVFHGVSWNINGRHVVVLKQNSKSHARWIFDLLHELYHVFVHLEKENTSVIEYEELNPILDNGSVEELEANSFANKFIFGEGAGSLAEKCVETASWKLENLKGAVSKVSKAENVGSDFLANYLAFRLAYQGQDWWGTANNMQIIEPLPFAVATNIFLENAQIQKLGPIERNILNTAISNIN